MSKAKKPTDNAMRGYTVTMTETHPLQGDLRRALYGESADLFPPERTPAMFVVNPERVLQRLWAMVGPTARKPARGAAADQPLFAALEAKSC